MSTNVWSCQKSRWFPALFLTQSWKPSQFLGDSHFLIENPKFHAAFRRVKNKLPTVTLKALPDFSHPPLHSHSSPVIPLSPAPVLGTSQPYFSSDLHTCVLCLKIPPALYPWLMLTHYVSLKYLLLTRLPLGAPDEIRSCYYSSSQLLYFPFIRL